MFLKSQGFQNEAKMVPKRAEKRKKRREEGKGEQRSAKHLVQTVQRCHKSTVQNSLRRHPEISGIPGGAFGAFLDDFLCYWGPKGSKIKPKWYPHGPRGRTRAEKKRKENRGRTKMCVCVCVCACATAFDFRGHWGRVGRVHNLTLAD